MAQGAFFRFSHTDASAIADAEQFRLSFPQTDYLRLLFLKVRFQLLQL
ncbi:hypothetical protein SLEP1_g4013 [Rubroshorea leprosula]|uniref:Uncharacterized protein n=1 Tax=Rubroshorea leprosula TaxID=152421 RepID=A0AAV5HTB8_9ROSI|nr:hypothetical protein SLEP1_g4013 [Rubroshorea leprosula]